MKKELTDIFEVDSVLKTLVLCELTMGSIAAKNKYVIDSYIDNAVGIMEKDSEGKISMTQVTLKPHVKFLGDKQPTREQLEKMHHQSHQQCFIANSVKTKIITEIIP